MRLLGLLAAILRNLLSRRYYTVYDRQRMLIGFALAQQNSSAPQEMLQMTEVGSKVLQKSGLKAPLPTSCKPKKTNKPPQV